MPVELVLDIKKPLEELFDLFADYKLYQAVAYRAGATHRKPTRVKRLDNGPLRIGSSWESRAGLLYGFKKVTARLTDTRGQRRLSAAKTVP